jgi:hypothetical protein
VARPGGLDAGEDERHASRVPLVAMADDHSKQLNPPPPITTSGLQVGAPLHSGQFKEGHGPMGGRPKGSRNRIKADLSQTILNAAARAGFMRLDEHGKRIGTGEGYLFWLAINEPKTMAALLARILPYHIVPELPNKSTLSYEETVAQLRERGLPPELIDHLRKAPPEAEQLWPGELENPYGPLKNVTPKSDT